MSIKIHDRPKWRMPSTQEISNEWDWEYSRNILGDKSPYDVFRTKSEFIDAIKKSKLVKVSKSFDNKIDNRSQTSSISSLKALVATYKHPRNINRIVDGMIHGATFPAPIVLKDGADYMILSGNSRMDVAFILGIEPVVVMLDVNKK